MLNKIETIIKSIGAKHNCYCTFSIKSGYKNKQPDYANTVSYSTYISAAISGTTHQDHATIEEVVKRFQDFLAVNNLYAYNVELAQQKLESLLEEQESINEDITTMREIIASHKE